MDGIWIIPAFVGFAGIFGLVGFISLLRAGAFEARRSPLDQGKATDQGSAAPDSRKDQS